MNDLLGWAVPLTLTGLVGAVAWIVRLAMVITVLQKDNEAQSKEIDGLGQRLSDHEAWDRAQHKELFDSRNETTGIMARIVAKLEDIGKNVDEILDRERRRNGVH